MQSLTGTQFLITRPAEPTTLVVEFGETDQIVLSSE
jgi:hypothetical protein